MRSSLATDQEFKLWLLLYRTREAIYKARQKELNEYGVTPRHAAVLRAVKIIGSKATPAEISRCLHVRPHAVSTMVSRMEKAGLVRKRKDLERKNLTRVVLTEKGKQLLQQSARRQSIHSIMSSLGEEERRRLRSYLETLWFAATKEAGTDLKAPFAPYEETLETEA